MMVGVDVGVVRFLRLRVEKGEEVFRADSTYKVCCGLPLVVDGVNSSSKGVHKGILCPGGSWSTSMPVAHVEVPAWS